MLSFVDTGQLTETGRPNCLVEGCFLSVYRPPPSPQNKSTTAMFLEQFSDFFFFFFWCLFCLFLFFGFFFFFFVPQLYLWGSPFLVRFFHTLPFFNPTIMEVTFRLHGW